MTHLTEPQRLPSMTVLTDNQCCNRRPKALMHAGRFRLTPESTLAELADCQPARSRQGFFMSAGYATGDNHDCAGNQGDEPSTSRGAEQCPIQHAPRNRVSPCGKRSPSYIRSLISERRMQRNNALAGEPRAGLSYPRLHSAARRMRAYKEIAHGISK